MAQQVKFETLRTVAFGGISGTYAVLGTPLVNPARLICITNNTNGDLLISVDGTTDVLFIPTLSFKLFDFATNRLNQDPTFVVPALTQFYVKQSTAPSTGAVYLEVIYGAPV